MGGFSRANVSAALAAMYPGQVGQGGAASRFMNFYANNTRSIATGVGSLLLHPVYSGPNPITIDQLDANIVSLYGVGGLLRAGVYLIINQANPFAALLTTPWASLLFDAGNVATDGTTGVKTWAVSPALVIPENTFFAIAGVELVSSTGTRTVAGSSVSGWSNMGVSNAASSYLSTQGFAYQMTGVGPTLPSLVTVTSSAPLNIDDGIGFRRAA